MGCGVSTPYGGGPGRPLSYNYKPGSVVVAGSAEIDTDCEPQVLKNITGEPQNSDDTSQTNNNTQVPPMPAATVPTSSSSIAPIKRMGSGPTAADLISGAAVGGNGYQSKAELEASMVTSTTVLREVPKTLHEGMTLYYLDHFVSQAKTANNNSRSISVWRESEVKKLDRLAGTALLHFVGLSKGNDRQIDILLEWTNIAHTDLTLNRKQRQKGLPLTDDQLIQSHYLLHTGKALPLQTVADQHPPQVQRTESTNNAALNHYHCGQQLDIQDVFITKKTEEIKCKWRSAQVVAVSGNVIRIHYTGWEDKWDEVLDVVQDKHRIREAGVMTSLQQRKSLLLDTSPGLVLGDSTNTTKNQNSSSAMMSSLQSPANSTVGTANNNRRGSLARRKSLNGTPKSSGDQAAFDRWMAIDSPAAALHLQQHQAVMGAGGSPAAAKGALTPSSRRASVVVPKGMLQKHHSLKDLEVSKSELAFEDRMEQAGMYIVEVEGDGNCLFRAVAHQLYMDESRHNELRQKAIEHMAKHSERFALFSSVPIHEHLRRMSTLGTWADDLEIRALEEILDRIFLIFSPDSSKDLVPVPMNINFSELALVSPDPPIKLSYHGNNHYNSVFDPQTGLPLDARPTKRVLNARLRLFAVKR